MSPVRKRWLISHWQIYYCSRWHEQQPQETEERKEGNLLQQTNPIQSVTLKPNILCRLPNVYFYYTESAVNVFPSIPIISHILLVQFKKHFGKIPLPLLLLICQHKGTLGCINPSISTSFNAKPGWKLLKYKAYFLYPNFTKSFFLKDFLKLRVHQRCLPWVFQLGW